MIIYSKKGVSLREGFVRTEDLRGYSEKLPSSKLEKLGLPFGKSSV